MNPLAPFGKLYGRITDLRNLLYDRDVLKSYDLGARTISVGNLTTGGTGKTPLVALITKMLIERGETVCILTRGYGRKAANTRVLVSDGTKVLVEAETGGDEPVELAVKLDGQAVIVADPDRVTAARWARDNFNITTFILDDGFQHRRARRDLDIVCIDATNPCGNGRILPAGTLRESFKSLIRANVVVITRTEQVDQTTELEERLRTRNPNALIFKAKTKLISLVPIDEFRGDSIRQMEFSEDVAAFTGLGNPDNFFKSLDLANVNVVARESFADHHRFTPKDISYLELKAKESGSTALVTTVKDAVKLKGLKFTFPCYVALAETIVDDPDAFKTLITAT